MCVGQLSLVSLVAMVSYIFHSPPLSTSQVFCMNSIKGSRQRRGRCCVWYLTVSILFSPINRIFILHWHSINTEQAWHLAVWWSLMNLLILVTFLKMYTRSLNSLYSQYLPRLKYSACDTSESVKRNCTLYNNFIFP